MVPTLQEAKAHLRVDHGDEDALIQGYLDAAVDVVESFTERAFTGDGAEAMPPAVRQAVLVLIDDYYENREAKAAPTTMTTAEALMWPKRAKVPL